MMGEIIPWLFVIPPGVVTVVGFVAWGLARTPKGKAQRLLIEGGQHLHREEFEDAEKLFRQGLELSPDHTGLLGTLASLLVKLGRYDEAGPMLDKALSHKPDVRLSLVKGKLLMETEQREEAMKILESIPEDADVFLDAQGLVAAEYERTDNIEAAIKAVKAAIKVGTVHQRRPFKKELTRLEKLIPKDEPT